MQGNRKKRIRRALFLNGHFAHGPCGPCSAIRDSQLVGRDPGDNKQRWRPRLTAKGLNRAGGLITQPREDADAPVTEWVAQKRLENDT